MRKIDLVIAVLAAATQVAGAQTFNSGIPAGYTCAPGGMCSTTPTPTGDIGPSPLGSTRVGFVTTMQSGNTANPLAIPGSTNGSQLRSSAFTGVTGQALSFYFDFITSDGAGYSDYAYVQLISQTTSVATTLFTARTNPSGSTVPGFGLPGLAPGVVIAPGTVTIIPNATNFLAGLGAESGACWAVGCGNTGWVAASYNLVADDSYKLLFGVNNMNDGGFQSALLFDYAAGEGGVPTISDTTTPEPSSVVLLATALAAVAVFRRRARRATELRDAIV